MLKWAISVTDTAPAAFTRLARRDSRRDKTPESTGGLSLTPPKVGHPLYYRKRGQTNFRAQKQGFFVKAAQGLHEVLHYQTPCF